MAVAVRSGLAVALLSAAALSAAVLGVVLATGGPEPGDPAAGVGPAPPPPAPAALHVDPARGVDFDDGSPARPLRTINAALDRAGPGTTVHLAPGVYREYVRTVRDGRADAPIVVKGPERGLDRAGRFRAVLFAEGRGFSVNHSHHVLDGFTIDGQEQLHGKPLPRNIRTINAFKDAIQHRVVDSRLVYIGSDDAVRDVTGVRVTNMYLHGAGGECVRMRNNARANEVSRSVIEYCGLRARERGPERDRYHNGEAVYIGTSPESVDQPMHDNDQSSYNVVRDNVIRPFGAECFNVKENAHHNVMEGNTCSGNVQGVQYNGSNVELRGHGNVVRNNRISDSAGAAVKIRSDEGRYDKGGNTVTANQISAAVVALQLVSVARQGPICGNLVAGTSAPHAPGGPGFAAPC
jgi:hypothetical protein